MKIETECLLVRHLFWEFYAQYHLWFCLGSGRKEYGYNVERIFSERIVEKINERFENITNIFLEIIVKKLEASIRMEMRYAFNPKWVDFCEATNKYLFLNLGDIYEKTTYLRGKRSFQSYLKNIGVSNEISSDKADIRLAKSAFLWEGWDEHYCGKKWAKACSVFLDDPKIKSLKNKIYWIDTTLDLYHNNGFLMNKTAFAVLEAFDDLKARAYLRSWPEIALCNIRIDNGIYLKENDLQIDINQRLYPLTHKTRDLIIRYKDLL